MLPRDYARHGLAWLVALVAAGPGVAPAQPPPPGATRPLSPDEALRTFELPGGFRIELVAAEPDVLDPVAMSFDADGRLYVVEMRDYPSGPPAPPGQVRRLEDLDGDGRMDRSTVFADGLPYPTGVLAWKGGVLVTAAPDILYFRDTDDDGTADVREVVFTGFGEGNPQHRLNGLSYGIDNWIYGANGYGAIRPGGAAAADAVEVVGSDFRIRPDGRRFEAVSGRSQFAMALDDRGNRFINHNSNHIRHPVPPRRYLGRNPHLATPDPIEDISDHGALAKVYPISPIEERFNQFDHAGYTTTACGLQIYRGGAFPSEYRGNAFVCEPLHSLIHRDVLVPDGVSFVAHRGDRGFDFLASRDNWFRPVNLAAGPDGALYVADFYRAVIEHPFGIPVEIQRRLDFRAGDDKGRIYRVVHEAARPRARPALGRAMAAELVAHLDDPDAWWRLAAQRLLVERQDRSAVGPLKALVRDASGVLARLHALYTLDGLGALDAPLVTAALRDTDAHVREHALALAEGFFPGEDAGGLIAAALSLADDPSPRVRFQLAFTLGELLRSGADDGRAINVLAHLAARDAAEVWPRVAVLSSVPGSEEALLARLCRLHPDWLAEPGPGAAELARMIAETVGSRGDRGQVAALLRLVATAPEAATGPRPDGRPVAWQTAALAALVARLHQASIDLDPLIRETGVGSVLSRWAAQLAETVADTDQPPARRIEAINLLVLAPEAAGRAQVRSKLEALLEPREPQDIQRAAVRALAARPGREAAADLLRRWRGLSVPVRDEVLTALLSRPERAALLLEAIAAGRVAAPEIGPSRRDQLLRYPDESVRKRAEQLFESPTPAERRRKLDEVAARVVTMPGDVDEGRRLFVEHCSNCHNRRTESEGILHRGEAGNLGPDLGGVRERPKEALLADILEPNRLVEPRYVSYTIATGDGQVVSGMITSETAAGITVKDGKQERTIARTSVKELVSTGLSVMPEGLEDTLTPEDLADLLEYLRAP
jgi:putative membrane-bound dehydrogenase-like protein